MGKIKQLLIKLKNTIYPKYWTDPVWSKVISAAIIALVGFIYVWIKSLYDEVSFISVAEQVVDYFKLKTEVNNFVLWILVFAFFVVVYSFLKGILNKIKASKMVSEENTKTKIPDPIETAHEIVNKFRGVLAKSFPKTVKGFELRHSYKSMNHDKFEFSLDSDIDQLLTNLSSKDFGNYLWFTNGGGLAPLNVKLKKSDNGIWLIGATNQEIMISSIIVYCDDSYRDREIIILRTEAMEPFPSYSPKNDISQEIALINGKIPISTVEARNGHAKIDDKTINLEDKEIEYRKRNLKPQIFLICTKFHRAYQPETVDIINDFINKELNHKDYGTINIPYSYPELRLESCEKLVAQISKFKHFAFED
jgi:hypothetical protein